MLLRVRDASRLHKGTDARAIGHWTCQRLLTASWARCSKVPGQAGQPILASPRGMDVSSVVSRTWIAGATGGFCSQRRKLLGDGSNGGASPRRPRTVVAPPTRLPRHARGAGESATLLSDASLAGSGAWGRALVGLVLVGIALFGPSPVVFGAQRVPELRWAADAEGGAPFVEADPRDPRRVVGFDVDVADLISRALGRTPTFVQVGFTALEGSVSRGDVHVALGGIEDSPSRRVRFALTIPYYEFREVLTVRQADRTRFRTLADLRGRRVATLGSTLAAMLLADAHNDGVDVVLYEDDVHPYSDLALGRVDAVVLDEALAERGTRLNPGLVSQSEALAVGHYVGLLALVNADLRDQVNAVLRNSMRDGRLEAIFTRWGLWNADQQRLYDRVLSDEVSNVTDGAAGLSRTQDSLWTQARNLAPTLLRSAVVTLLLSVAAMSLAVVWGMAIAIGRVYGPALLRAVLDTLVEVLRGTPLLLQLFLLYFGLAPLVQLPAVVAALLGLGLNYAAYESEIHRSALEAVPRGQLDAARTLALSDRQVLWHVRGPQALRLALPAMTNDFVALLKDSSLVSVITVVELTKQTSIFAANTGSWLVPGLLCAAVYLAMSLPVARLARALERRWAKA